MKVITKKVCNRAKESINIQTGEATMVIGKMEKDIVILVNKVNKESKLLLTVIFIREIGKMKLA